MVRNTIYCYFSINSLWISPKYWVLAFVEWRWQNNWLFHIHRSSTMNRQCWKMCTFFCIRVTIPIHSIRIGCGTTFDRCEQMPDAIKVLFDGCVLLVKRSTYTEEAVRHIIAVPTPVYLLFFLKKKRERERERERERDMSIKENLDCTWCLLTTICIVIPNRHIMLSQ